MCVQSVVSDLPLLEVKCSDAKEVGGAPLVHGVVDEQAQVCREAKGGGNGI